MANDTKMGMHISQLGAVRNELDLSGEKKRIMEEQLNKRWLGFAEAYNDVFNLPRDTGILYSHFVVL